MNISQDNGIDDVASKDVCSHIRIRYPGVFLFDRAETELDEASLIVSMYVHLKYLKSHGHKVTRPLNTNPSTKYSPLLRAANASLSQHRAALFCKKIYFKCKLGVTFVISIRSA